MSIMMHLHLYSFHDKRMPAGNSNFQTRFLFKASILLLLTFLPLTLNFLPSFQLILFPSSGQRNCTIEKDFKIEKVPLPKFSNDSLRQLEFNNPFEASIQVMFPSHSALISISLSVLLPCSLDKRGKERGERPLFLLPITRMIPSPSKEMSPIVGMK